MSLTRTGRSRQKHRKVHLFDIDVAGGQQFFESDTLSPGQHYTLFDTPFGKVGVAICFDVRFAELFRILALEGAQLIVVPAAFNMTTGPAHWELLFRARALDNQCFLAGCAPARDETAGYVSYAHSLVCDPWGRVQAQAGAAPELLICDIDFAQADAVRAQIPVFARAANGPVSAQIRKKTRDFHESFFMMSVTVSVWLSTRNLIS